MSIARGLLSLFLLPGNLVLRFLNTTIEQDGGILRSFVNMCVWGAIFTGIALKYFS